MERVIFSLFLYLEVIAVIQNENAMDKILSSYVFQSSSLEKRKLQSLI